MTEWIEEEFNLSGHWASPIINGDDSGLSDKETRQLHRFLKTVQAGKVGHWDGWNEGEGNFSRDDITWLMADCYPVKFIWRKE